MQTGAFVSLRCMLAPFCSQQQDTWRNGIDLSSTPAHVLKPPCGDNIGSVIQLNRYFNYFHSEANSGFLGLSDTVVGRISGKSIAGMFSCFLTLGKK